jgi:8-oxo-dGTP diphosphatase
MQAAIREAYEETQVKISNVKQFHTYSDPSRDPRGHNITIVYTADTIDNPIAADDAKSIGWFDLETHMVYTLKNGYLYDSLCFDHAQILMDVIRYQKTGEKPNRE